LSGKTFGDAAFTVGATASSGLPVTFTSISPAVCTTGGTNGATVTLVQAGTCTIAANQAGNATYGPAPQVTQGFSVTGLVPGAPVIGVAAAGNGQATVSFAAPSSNGGSPITSYTATSSPGSLMATGASSPLTVSGLINGTAYTFTVTATNATGTGAASAASNSVTPTSVLGIPSGVIATTSSSTAVGVAWTGSMNAVSYEIGRSSNGSTFVVVGSSAGSAFTDTTAAANTAYLFAVRAVGAMADRSPYSTADLATTVIFADDPLVVGMTGVKSVHVTQLRTAVNAVRILAGAGAASFTDPDLGTSIFVRKIHMDELRTALNGGRTALLLPAISFTEPTLTALATTIKAIHFAELRAGVK
jgi:hypothetical protein